MSENWQARQALLMGEEALRLLSSKTVAVIGLGGVGGACAEGLCRGGVGGLILMDHDTVDETNLNRQLFALRSTVGMDNTEAAAARLRDINPACRLSLLPAFYGPETAESLFSLRPDYVVDCIDTVSAKLHLAAECQARGIPLLMSLGTGNRLDPAAFRIGKLSDTAQVGGDGLARAMRREVKKRGLQDPDVLYSTELPRKAVLSDGRRYAPGSVSFCPPVAGYIEAGEVIRRLVGIR